MSKKRLLSAAIGLCLLTLQLVAQPKPERFSPREYARELETYIVQQACLTPSEAEAFFPLFHELRDKQRAINWQILEIKKQKPTPDNTNKDYYNRLNKINDLIIEAAELEGEYYRKMCKAVSAQKVYNAILSEDNFHRRMLKRFSHQEAPKNNSKK